MQSPKLEGLSEEEFFVESALPRRSILVDWLRLRGVTAKASGDSDIDIVADSLDTDTKEMLLNAGYRFYPNIEESKMLHVHSPIRKKFSWYQRW